MIAKLIFYHCPYYLTAAIKTRCQPILVETTTEQPSNSLAQKIINLTHVRRDTLGHRWWGSERRKLQRKRIPSIKFHQKVEKHLRFNRSTKMQLA